MGDREKDEKMIDGEDSKRDVGRRKDEEMIGKKLRKCIEKMCSVLSISLKKVES